jgi:chromosome segregation ATPase
MALRNSKASKELLIKHDQITSNINDATSRLNAIDAELNKIQGKGGVVYNNKRNKLTTERQNVKRELTKYKSQLTRFNKTNNFDESWRDNLDIVDKYNYGALSRERKGNQKLFDEHNAKITEADNAITNAESKINRLKNIRDNQHSKQYNKYRAKFDSEGN